MKSKLNRLEEEEEEEEGEGNLTPVGTDVENGEGWGPDDEEVTSEKNKNNSKDKM
jgi:hypothetical protein